MHTIKYNLKRKTSSCGFTLAKPISVMQAVNGAKLSCITWKALCICCLSRISNSLSSLKPATASKNIHISLSNRIYSAYDSIQETTISRYYKPLSWLPHVTLGKTLDKEQMQRAFQVMQESFAPFTACITEIGLAKVNPHEDVLRFKL